MCKAKKYPKIPNVRIDKCLKKVIENLNGMFDANHETVASCCGHGKYPMTIIIKNTHGNYWELFSSRMILRKRNFYKRDKEGYYYIPECL